MEIKKRLSVLGDLPAVANNRVFDKTLEDAVKFFQKRFGRKEDGIVGQQIIRELDVPFE
ncbi:MAG: peptidoglycan-binding protein [Chitinophagaceae bacterium]